MGAERFVSQDEQEAGGAAVAGAEDIEAVREVGGGGAEDHGDAGDSGEGLLQPRQLGLAPGHAVALDQQLGR